jgi:cytochrome oxidase Cu insertion factor (SCO1/SenC/PrrC family)
MQHTIKKTRTKFYLLLLIFIFPLVGSSLLYHFRDHFHFKTTNLGTLVSPAIDVKNIWKTSTQRKWHIVYVTAKECDEQCKLIAHQLHQIQIALGKDHERVDILQPQEDIAKLKNAFDSQSQKEFVINEKIYLVDPNGNLFMYYPSSTNPMNILKDIKKVLKASQIG